MAIFRLKTPVSEEQIRKLKVKDIVYLSGTVVTARDQAHKRALDWGKEGKALPVALEGLAVYHCGPVVRKRDHGWFAVAAGPTTSTRLEAYEADFLQNFKPRIVIGKGGMGKRTTEAMERLGAVYCVFTGGAAVLAAKSILNVKHVEWLDLGVPEAMWVFEVESFGPMIVAIDSHGSNLFADVAQDVEKNKKRIYKKIGL